ncbi:MAG: hypothetical protein ACOCV9_01745 [Marinilabiliaceae bacterium]
MTSSHLSDQEIEENVDGFMNAEDGEVYYQRVFKDVSLSEIDDNILQSGAELVEKNGFKNRYKVEDHSIDYKKYGGSTMSVPIYLRNKFSFVVTGEEKDNRSRVTITNIQVHDETTIDMGTVESGPSVFNLEKLVLNGNGEFKNSQIEALYYISKDFSYLVRRNSGKFEDDW